MNAGARTGNDGENRAIAERFDRVADLLEAQGADPFRIRAYREGAAVLRHREEPVRGALVREGRAGLERIPGVGPSLAALIEEYAHTGRIALLERLEGASASGEAFRRVPGLGPVLAERIHDRLGIETLEELEVAAHDGRLARVPGFGPRRVAAVRATLAGILGWRSRARRRIARDRFPDTPAVADLLAVDATYREQAAAGRLERIAPHRFNPTGRAWLPILHATRHGWAITALFSNTALAHRLGRTHDWVVVYYERDGEEGQCTVVTETRGDLQGWRVVRGRERECLAHYAERHGWLIGPHPDPRSKRVSVRPASSRGNRGNGGRR